MNGNDSRYDKSKQRTAKDQYSPRQHKFNGRKEVAAQANPTQTRSPKSSTTEPAWAPTGRVTDTHHHGDQAAVIRLGDPAEYDTRRDHPAVRAGSRSEITSELTADRGVVDERERFRDGHNDGQDPRGSERYDTRRGHPAVRAGSEITSKLTADRGVEFERGRFRDGHNDGGGGAIASAADSHTGASNADLIALETTRGFLFGKQFH